jgi:hypothetical protein
MYFTIERFFITNSGQITAKPVRVQQPKGRAEWVSMASLRKRRDAQPNVSLPPGPHKPNDLELFGDSHRVVTQSGASLMT